MPREPRCSICQSAAARTAVDALIAQGKSIRDVAGQTKCTRSSIHRHVGHSSREKTGGASRKSGGSATSSQARRISAGRCSTCGLSAGETDAQSLLRRAERILWIAETIAAQAQRDDDARLALQAVDRARSSLETMMRATGLIGGDGQVTVNVDARKVAFERLARLPDDFIRRVSDGDSEALGALVAATEDE